MRRLAQAIRTTPPARRAAPRPPAPTTSFRPAGPDVSAAVSGPGRSLPGPLRAEMETGFGRDLGHVRVHDGPPATTAAGALRARAFTLGPHIAFAGGQYRPDSPDGRGLLAHELAHVLQTPGGSGASAGVVGPHDPGAEAEADRAVRTLAAGGTPVIGARPGPAVVRRAPDAEAPPPPVPVPASAAGTAAAPTTAAPQPGTTAPPELRLPTGLRVITDVPEGIGTTELVVEKDQFDLPLQKGAGSWVQKAYDDAAGGGRLIFTPIFTSGGNVAAYKEGAEDYKSVWLGAFGFADTGKLADTITASENEKVKAKLADPAVKQLVTGLGKSLRASGCDIDHIVEKQVGGTSIPSNLQLLTGTINRASGSATYQSLVEIVRQIREPGMRGPNVRNLQIRIARAVVPTGPPDASFEVEGLLRDGLVRGSDAEKAKAAGKPVRLTAGGQGETAQLRDTGETPLDTLVRRIVPGMRMERYRRAAGGAKSGHDTVLAALDSRAMRATGAGSAITLRAELDAATAPAPAAAPGPEATPDPVAATPGETRRLTLDDKENKHVAFFYPYLSPGELTQVRLDAQGNLSGEGAIRSSVPFLGRLNVVYAKDELKLVAPIPADKLVSPLPSSFRFTGGEVALQLSPDLVPNANLTFTVGPANKPILNGTLSATVANGAFVATGELTPAGKLPGITAAAGQVVWNSAEGWSGRIKASSSSIPNSTADVEIGFRTVGGRLDPYAKGDIVTSVRNSELRLGARWEGGGLTYSGSVRVDKPLPLVDSARLAGRYSDRGLYLSGDADIVWKQLRGSMKVEYSRREDEEEGRFSGSATLAVKTEKADGSIALSFDADGRYWGKGSIGYRLTKDIKPVLGVEITRDRRVRLSGQVAVADIVLARRWPSGEGGKVPLIKGASAKFSFLTPVGATAFVEVRGSLNLVYGIGPVVLRGVVLAGELYPFEDDPRITAKLNGTFAVPAYAGLEGTFGANIGAEFLGGAAGVKGGIDISPSLRIQGEVGVGVAADYAQGGFSFEADAYATGELVAAAKVGLSAEIYAAWGLFSHTWTYDVASVSAKLGPQIRLTLGRIAYARNGEITWPSLSQIKVEPDSIDPVQVVREMLGKGKAVKQ